MQMQGGEEVNDDTDLPFKELGCLPSKRLIGGTYLRGRDDFHLGNNEFKEPVRQLRVYELICRMQF